MKSNADLEHVLNILNHLKNRLSHHVDQVLQSLQTQFGPDLDSAYTPQQGPTPPTPVGPIASYIDQTLLKPEATADQITQLCQEAVEHQFAGVCVQPSYVPLVAKLLEGSEVLPVTVVGFPLGTTSTRAKIYEARVAVQAGAKEIDMVIHLGALRAKDYAYVLKDIRHVVEACAPRPVKVILETAELDTDEKIVGCALAKAAGASFVKTSTGFGKGGATVEDVKLMRRVVGPEMGVKASGGIRTYEDAMKMISAGATRIGTSAGVAIVSHGSGLTTVAQKSGGSNEELRKEY